MAFVLIVEDTEDTFPLEIALESRCDLESRVVKNGRAALALLEEGTADLTAVITDLHLPLLDGFDLIAAIRSDARYAKSPIIVVSGDSDSTSRTRAIQLGADAFFTKPYSPSEVCRNLEDLLHAL